jgi:lipopolysaccharide transport system permease protein
MDLSARESITILEPASASPPSASATDEQYRPSEPSLLEEPLVVIEPSRPWVALKLRDLWAFRELLFFLIWRDLKVRYKQTVLGALWVVMQPLLMTVVFTIFLGKLARVPSGNIPYPIFVYSALLPWMFFSTAVNNSGNSLVGNAQLITKIYFPRMIIPFSAVGARLVDFTISFLILAGMMAYYGVGVTWKLAMLPVLVLLITALALSIGMLTSALNVKYRDVGVALPVFMQLWMFVSPVVYPPELVPSNWQKVYELNPLVGIITSFRAAVLGGDFYWRALAISSTMTLLLLVFSAYTFRRMEKGFVDII